MAAIKRIAKDHNSSVLMYGLIIKDEKLDCWMISIAVNANPWYYWGGAHAQLTPQRDSRAYKLGVAKRQLETLKSTTSITNALSRGVSTY